MAEPDIRSSRDTEMVVVVLTKTKSNLCFNDTVSFTIFHFCQMDNFLFITWRIVSSQFDHQVQKLNKSMQLNNWHCDLLSSSTQTSTVWPSSTLKDVWDKLRNTSEKGVHIFYRRRLDICNLLMSDKINYN